MHFDNFDVVGVRGERIDDGLPCLLMGTRQHRDLWNAGKLEKRNRLVDSVKRIDIPNLNGSEYEHRLLSSALGGTSAGFLICICHLLFTPTFGLPVCAS